MSGLCDSQTDVENEDGDVVRVDCSLPRGHREDHQGAFWWPSDDTHSDEIVGVTDDASRQTSPVEEQA